MFYNKYQFGGLIALLSVFIVGFSIRIGKEERTRGFFPSINIVVSGFLLWRMGEMMRCNLWSQGRTFIEEVAIFAGLVAGAGLFALPALAAEDN